MFTELDTFVKKFQQLWNDGITAHLDLDTHAGDAWVGLRVRIWQVPGPLHQQPHSFHQEAQRKESPSLQRRRARWAAARLSSRTNSEAVEAEEVVEETTGEQTVADDAVGQVAEHPAVKANRVDEVTDELCSNEEFNENFLSNENSVKFRIIVQDTKDIEAFISKVRQSFLTNEVDFLNQYFEVSGYEKLKDHSKFYLKIKNDVKAIEALRTLTAENILIRKLPTKKPNS